MILDRRNPLIFALLGAVICVVLASAASGGPARSATVAATFPAYRGAVPVLLYHRLFTGAANDPYSVAPATFDAEMERLRALGFEAITLDQYVRFMRGETVDLPPRPILITFDDGCLSAWENADPILAQYGWSAAMYIPTGFVGRPGYLTWDQLRQMQASGRWQIDEHAGNGHVSVPVGADGATGPFYANELWQDGNQETFADYRLRVGGDILHGAQVLASSLPGWSSHGTFAVPFNNYGQNGSNDPRIEPWLADFLKAHFTVVFVQKKDAGFTTPGEPFADRIEVPSEWDADALETHLRDGLAATRGVLSAAARKSR